MQALGVLSSAGSGCLVLPDRRTFDCTMAIVRDTPITYKRDQIALLSLPR